MRGCKRDTQHPFLFKLNNCRSSPMRFYSPGFHEQSVSADTCTVSTSCGSTGNIGKVYTNSEDAPFFISGIWFPALSYYWLPKNVECCQNQESLRVNLIHIKGQQWNLLCFTYLQPKNNTHTKKSWTILAANFVLPLKIAFIFAYSNSRIHTYHSTWTHYRFNLSLIFRIFFSFSKPSH